MSSALGKAIGLTASSAWATIVTAIKGIIAKTSGSTTIATNKLGWDSANNLWCYIPTNGYYTTSHWLKMLNADVASKIGLSASKIIKGNTILGIAGTDAGYNAGYKAGVAAAVSPAVTTGLTIYTGNPEGRKLTRSLSAPSNGVYMFLLALILPHNSGVGTITTSTTGTSKMKYDSANNCANQPRIAFHVARLTSGQTITYTVNSVGAGQDWSYIMLKLSS